VVVAMEQKLRTPEGRRRYLRRQASVEPVVGIIKRVLGFEQFSLRGLQKATLEWNLLCVAYNLKRLHKLTSPPQEKPKAPKTPKPTPLQIRQAPRAGYFDLWRYVLHELLEVIFEKTGQA
jgi:hypothetical protein